MDRAENSLYQTPCNSFIAHRLQWILPISSHISLKIFSSKTIYEIYFESVLNALTRCHFRLSVLVLYRSCITSCRYLTMFRWWQEMWLHFQISVHTMFLILNSVDIFCKTELLYGKCLIAWNLSLIKPDWLRAISITNLIRYTPSREISDWITTHR